MTKKFKNYLLSAATIIFATAIVITVVNAGSLTPTGTPTATMYTLQDIWQKITDNDNPSLPTEGNHIFPPSSNPAGTMHTLAEIYTEIPTLDASKILTGTTYMGVAGTATAGIPQPVWQPDPNIDLCWDNTFCSAGDGLLQPPGTSVLMGAVEYCRYLNLDGETLNCSGGSCSIVDYWRLPTDVELMIALSNSWIPGGTDYPGDFRIGIDYRSSFEIGINTRIGNGAFGYFFFGNLGKEDLVGVRCVH